MIHYATLHPTNGQWQSLCGTPGEQVHGTLVIESEITCPTCRGKWRAGMKRVWKILADYQGEE